MNFLLFIRIKKKIQDILKQQNINIWEKQTPQLPYILYILDLGTNGNKNVYFSTVESGNSIIKQVQVKWSKRLDDELTFDSVTSGFKIIKVIAPSVYQHFNNFKLLHRQTVHNKLLFKMGISETPNFFFCKIEIESIEQAYIKCENIKKLGKVIEDWVKSIYDSHFKKSDIEGKFGDKDYQIKQLIILSVRDVIYSKRNTGKK